jgi:predicted ATP-grasp superfamily ATP-dependent carboligase
MATVLVTDGEQRAALAVVRSLGRAGHRVYVCSSRPRSLAGASRYAVGQVAVPDALREPAAFVSALERLVEGWGIDVVIPISEPSLLAILPERDRFPGARIPFAPYERFLAICDKAAVAAAAEEVGIRVPAQVVLTSPEEGRELEAGVRFPLVLKPGRSVIGDGAGRAKASVVHVADREQLESALRRLPPAAYPLLVQERIVGPGIGIFVLLEGGELRAAFAHRRIREKPPSGGVSVYRESAPLSPDLLERSLALLRRFDWEGVAMVEYKLDEATQTPYIMEINGRFWGSLQLAIDAGVDFPCLLLADPAETPPVTEYTVGVRSRWEWGDVDHLLARLRRSAEELALPPGSPGRLRAILDFLAAFGPGNRNEILRASDPGPFVRESLDWLRGR